MQKLIDTGNLSVDIVKEKRLLLIGTQNQRHQLFDGRVIARIQRIAHLSLLYQYGVVGVVHEDVVGVHCGDFAVDVLVFGSQIHIRRVAKVEGLLHRLHLKLHLRRRRLHINLLQFFGDAAVNCGVDFRESLWNKEHLLERFWDLHKRNGVGVDETWGSRDHWSATLHLRRKCLL